MKFYKIEPTLTVVKAGCHGGKTFSVLFLFYIFNLDNYYPTKYFLCEGSHPIHCWHGFIFWSKIIL